MSEKDMSFSDKRVEIPTLLIFIPQQISFYELHGGVKLELNVFLLCEPMPLIIGHERPDGDGITSQGRDHLQRFAGGNAGVVLALDDK